MALYWPEQKVALDIVDDPGRRPFEGDDSYTVLRVTCAELSNYESFDKIQHKLCELLGATYPTGEEWKRRNHVLFDALMSHGPDDVREHFLDGFLEDLERDEDDLEDDRPIEILAPTQEIADCVSKLARAEGHNVTGTVLWDGPVPDGSFEDYAPHMRMSTAEFFFLRKANELPLCEAVDLGNELCSHYRTKATAHNMDGGYDYLAKPRTTKARIRRYLRGARRTREGKRAKRVLRLVADECGSPMGSYLSVRLCLPAAKGGYGLPNAICCAVFEGRDGLAPSSDGPFLAYDLCWPKQRVALQYVGNRKPGKRVRNALDTEGVRAIVVCDSDLADEERFDKVARKLAQFLDEEVPPADDKTWLKARQELYKAFPVPDFDSMRLTLEDIAQHQ